WTVHDRFPPVPDAGPGIAWPLLGLALGAAAWAATLLARRWNARAGAALPVAACGAGPALAGAACRALGRARSAAGTGPTRHAYDATGSLLLGWTVLRLAVGALMQAYCIARRLAGRLGPGHDSDIRNTALYWHFAAITVVVTVATVAGFPVLAP